MGPRGGSKEEVDLAISIRFVYKVKAFFRLQISISWMAMSRFFAIAIALCAFTTGLFAHDVVYQSALKYYIQHQGSTPPALGYLLQLNFRKEAIPVSSLDSGEISVVHLDGEHCLVTATVT